MVRLASIILILILCVSLGGPILAAQPMEYRLGDRTLSYGAWGADVFELQLRLRELGYSLAADGHFGSETRRVVTAFQLAYGLRPDGIAGPATLAALQSLRSTFTYVVQPGDSLWAIARRFGVSMEEIVRLNNLPDRPLWVGDRLILPARPVYRVQPGDTLWEIARRFGTTVEELAELNGIADPSRIRAGSELRLPAGALPAGGF
ncbi:MAG: LysM peptidoglycan-binding domain-containing protein [Limnochordia bacterium]